MEGGWGKGGGSGRGGGRVKRVGLRAGRGREGGRKETIYNSNALLFLQ